jgi:hypothetical protein
MLDFVHWSAALLALIGLFLWFWSGRIGVSHAAADGGNLIARRKRQIRRVAICAAVVSALLQAAGASPATERQGVDLWASAAPAAVTPVG